MTVRSKTPKYRAMYSNMKDLGYEFLIDATGTKRRLQGLMCLGYSLTEIGRRVGMTQQSLSNLMHERKHVYRETRDKIAAVCDELCMTPNVSRTAVRTRIDAERRGYPSLLSWDDIDNDPWPVGVKGQCATDGCQRPARGDLCYRHHRLGVSA